MSELFPLSSSLVELAHALGNHPQRLALWGEGAVAARQSNGKFAVSTLGANLALLEARHLVELDLLKMRGFLAHETLDEAAMAELQTDPDAPTPSPSAFAFADLFAFEGIQYIAHTQPIQVNQVICSPRARQFADRRNTAHEVLHCGPASVLVPFVPTGFLMAREIKRKIALWQDRFKTVPKLIYIQNHGMITLGESVEEVLKLVEMTVKYAEIFIGASMMGGPEFLKPNYVTQIDATQVV